jgi:hypothetical protein
MEGSCSTDQSPQQAVVPVEEEEDEEECHMCTYKVPEDHCQRFVWNRIQNILPF